MRFLALQAGGAGACALAAVGAALCLSAPAQAIRWRCELTLTAPAAQAAAGEALTLSGSLECPLPEEAAGQEVQIMQHTSGTPGYSPLGEAQTEAGGSFTLAIPGGLSADSAFYARALGARSHRLLLRATAAVTISGPAQGSAFAPVGSHADIALRSARTVTFSGTVTPAAPGAVVALQREIPATESWRRIGYALVSPGGAWTISHGFEVPGAAMLRVVVHARGMRPAVSEELSYVIARQNARLGISSSGAELVAGQQVTISGVSAAGAGATLTLLARTPGAPYTPIASVRAGAGGRYEFAPQTPAETTYYRVRERGTGPHAPATSSAALREGVRPALTVQTPEASATAGQPDRICGTLTPAQPGETVYLQRADPAGLGFRDVAQVALGAGPDFCLPFLPPEAGSYRVLVPRTGTQDAVASSAVAIAAPPAEAGALSPAAPLSGTPASAS